MLTYQLLRIYDKKNIYIPGIYLEELLFFILHLTIRSFIIAVRYGSCSELRFTMLKEAS